MTPSAEHDIVIVGSGIAGAILARTLTQAGKSVLLLEAGLEAGLALEGESAYAGYQAYVKTFYEKANKATNGPYPQLPAAPSPDVLDIKAKTPYDTGYLVQQGPVPFASDCLRAPGGTTMHWLGNVPRMLPNDFRMFTLYGQGVDWPFDYEALRPYYELAEFEIGVSGSVDAQVGPDMGRRNYGPDYVFPMQEIPQSYQDKVWIRHGDGVPIDMGGTSYSLGFASMPQGRNSDPHPMYPYGAIHWDSARQKFALERSSHTYRVVGSTWSPYAGERCEGNAACVPLCPVQAKYNALKTLRRADPKRLSIRTQAVASRVLVDSATGEVSGIEVKRYAQAGGPVTETFTARGKHYVLAGSALENAKLLLSSGIANSSDQVGRNLMDHLVMLTWGLFKNEKVYPYRGPGCTTYIPTFRDGPFRRDQAAWISPIDNWGWSWPTFAPGTDVSAALQDGLFGSALRERIADVVPRQALLHFEVEQLPQADNRITVDPRYLDALGNHRPVIRYDISAYERKAFAAAKRVSDQIFDRVGIADKTRYTPDQPDHVMWDGKGYTFWGAGHIVGTHRMGTDPKTSVVKPTQQSWDHPNLYIVGCGSMPTLGTSNPTLTMAALTFMTAEDILRRSGTQSR